ncbi:MAG TPA: phosphate signaling complex protein PhoU [Candidatus Sulfotelmatobacter sp.]|nr:phosphate signaling complex protein PhoU [Candidatus Sulfotelmatobacter sp.]
MDHFEKELDTLKERLLLMANRAETAVSLAVQALLERNCSLALQVKESDRVIDRFELEIDDLGIQQLVKAPLAVDLRFITVSTKIAHNLERIGDEAAKIARRAADLCQEPPIRLELDIPAMASLALDMFKTALNALDHRNTAIARSVLPRDKEVDLFNRQIHGILAEFMMEHPGAINRCLHWMVVSKSLERIADHATNVAENVVFLYDGQDIRHTGAKNMSAIEILSA